ncbi:MAG: LptF/LptG family permease [Candidatus Sericytochromatia bacterium]
MKRILFALTIFLFWGLAASAAPAIDPCALAGGNSGCSPTEMSFWALYDLIKIREALGLAVFDQWTNLHLKISLPLATFFTTLLVAPIGLLVSRLGTSVSTAISISLVFIWYLLYAICAPLGKIGAINPFGAAWIQNLVFAAGGLVIWAWLNRDRLVFWRA